MLTAAQSQNFTSASQKMGSSLEDAQILEGILENSK